MLKNLIFIMVFIVAGVLFAEDKPKYESKFDEVDMSLQDIDSEVKFGNTPPTTIIKEVTVIKEIAPAPTIVATTPPPPPTEPLVSTPTPKKAEEIDGPIYHYAYVPDESLDEGTDYYEVTQAGHPGFFFMSFMGQGVFYKDYNKGVPGFEAEMGLQFNLFKYMSIAVALNATYRRGFVTGDKIYPFGAIGQLRFRVLPWLFPFFEGGIECIKIARAGWQPPSKVFGGGIMIRMGYADKKAEYNMYKTVSITRTMLVLAFDRTIVSGDINIVPDAYIFKGGLSFEF